MLVGKLKSGLIEIFNRDFDVGGEGIEFYDDDDDDELVVAQTVNIRIPGLRSMPLLVGAHYQTRRWPTKQPGSLSTVSLLYATLLYNTNHP